MIEDGTPGELAQLLSTPRLDTYQRHAAAWGCSPMSLYLLGEQLAASFHHDLAIAEVVLRNAMNDRLVEQYGPRWWADEKLLDERGQNAVAKAFKDARCTAESPPGRIVAQLAMGFWVHLLEPGGFVGRPPFRARRYYDAVLWRPALRHAFPNSPGIRTEVHAAVQRVYVLRNRIAHCEPIVAGAKVPGSRLRCGPSELHTDIVTLMRWISEPVGDWLAIRSRTPALLIDAPN